MLWNQAHAPLPPRTRSEASLFGGSHNYKTKQTTFLHRYRFHHFGTLFFNVVEGKVMKVLMVNFVDATKPSHKEVIKRSPSSFALFVFIFF